MSQVQLLRKLLKQRLPAADEVFGLFERTIAEYEEENSRLKEENKRVKVLDAVFQPEVRLFRADMQKLSVSKEDILLEQQKWNWSPNQEDSKPIIVEEEQEKLWTSRKEELLHWLEDADFTKFPFGPVKIENEEKHHLSGLNQCQSDDSTETDLVASCISEHRTLKIEGDVEDCGGLQQASKSHPCSHLQTDTEGRSADCCDTDDSAEWEQSSEPHSGLNCMKNIDISVSDNSSTIAKQFDCPEFKKTLDLTNDFTVHKITQASEKPKKPQIGHLNADMRSHNGKKSFDCSVCGNRYVEKSHLRTHMRTHTREKLFGCSECGRRYLEKSSLKTHMRSHTGEKPFGCSECGRRFGKKSSLNTHMRIHTGEKPFGCLECSKKFRTKSDLNRHMKIHAENKQFGCSECGKRFREKSSLDTHIKNHTVEKPFGCLECGARFRQNGALNRHMVIHTGEKAFGCCECGKTFGQKGTLKKHMRIHTRGKPFGCVNKLNEV